MPKIFRIGTRDSELAFWQANQVKSTLEAKGFLTELVPVKSIGDRNQEQPLYEMGITGIFTKALDVALINSEIDIAVHSMKDVPTKLPQNVVQAAVLPRANTEDILLHKGTGFLNSHKPATIATGSLRRKAQWLNRFPKDNVVNLRGNVNTRMRKLEQNKWQGAIFAAAGLERINLKPENSLPLEWMIPAPAQGAITILVRGEDTDSFKAVNGLNHETSHITTHIERQYLQTLEGGCTAPIGARAVVKGGTVYFEGAVFSLDGQSNLKTEETFKLENYHRKGHDMAAELLASGGDELMRKIKANLPNAGGA